MNKTWGVVYITVVSGFIAWLWRRMRSLESGPPEEVADTSSMPGPAGQADRNADKPVVESGQPGAGASAIGTDDLTRIKGIGKVIAPKLHALGIKTFAQIAQLSVDDIARIDGILSFKGRIEREDWVGQAERFAAQNKLRKNIH